MSDTVERAHNALEDGRPEEALELLSRASADDPARWCAEALAWRDLGELARASEAVARAGALAPAGDPDLAFARGEVALAAWDTRAARSAFERVQGWREDPVVLERLALLADLDGDLSRGARLLARARELDGAPLPPRLDPAAFGAAVAEALESLPAAFRDALDDIAVIADPMPRRELAAKDPAGTPPDLLGLFAGRSRLERHAESGPEPPPAVYLFQRNLERACADHAELREQIRITLFHELGHALGFEEDEVEGMGLG